MVFYQGKTGDFAWRPPGVLSCPHSVRRFGAGPGPRPANFGASDPPVILLILLLHQGLRVYHHFPHEFRDPRILVEGEGSHESFWKTYCWWFRNPGFTHQLRLGSWSPTIYDGFIPCRWRRIHHNPSTESRGPELHPENSHVPKWLVKYDPHSTSGSLPMGFLYIWIYTVKIPSRLRFWLFFLWRQFFYKGFSSNKSRAQLFLQSWTSRVHFHLYIRPF